MSDLSRMLRREQRRHFAISFGLVAAAVVAGMMVTNERGVFSNIPGLGGLSALERAFAAVAEEGPGRTPTLFRRVASFGPDGPLTDDPIDVLGTPADLRRRLMDALGEDADADAQAAAGRLPGILTQPITPTELAANELPAALGDLGDGGAGGPSAGSVNPPAAGPALVAQGDQDETSPTDPAGDGTPGAGPGTPVNDTPPVAPVPEPAVWALLIGGFGAVGAAQRRMTRRRRLAAD